MASGKIHKQANIVGGIFFTTTSFLMFENTEIVVGALIGSLIGTIVTPDLDLVVPSNFFSKLPIINFLWMCLWWPYKKIVKHRSFVSHSPLVSTILRLLYMLLWFFPLGVLFGFDFFGALDWVLYNYNFTISLFTCWVLQDLIHLWFDFVV